MMKKIILLMAAFVTSISAIQAQQLQNLPNDPATKVGKLENGLTYYIRHNDKPEQRAEFYLATDAGAIDEAPDQDGLAHFLEHMCFNGTKNFPGKGILNWLESIGASFGGNVNASTGIEQTVYMLNNIPLVRPTVVDTCLLIMHDYSHFVLCEDSEIDAERGVIIEEKRTRNVAAWRNFMEEKKYLFKDTPYAAVSLIGSQEQLETFRPESLRNFYHKWYVPSNQALIVVGDIDVDKVEAQIKATFADIPASPRPERNLASVPGNGEPIVGIVTDPENVSSDITVAWKSDARPAMFNSTAQGMMLDIIGDIVSTIMDERLHDLCSSSNPPFMKASFGIENAAIRSTDLVMTGAQDKAENIIPALEALMTEVEKMRRFGFTEDEVGRAKTEILSRYETAANKADTRKNSEFVRPCINNFFMNRSFMEPSVEYQVAQMIIAQLNAEILNQVASQIITKENMVVIYEGPGKEGIPVPTEEQILASIRKIQESEIARADGEAIPTSFLDPATLKGSKSKKSTEYLYGSEKITLANGMTVILLPTDYEKDKVSIRIEKKGGMSLIPDEDMDSFQSNILSAYLNNTGVSSFSRTVKNKMLSGKQVSAGSYVNGYTHGINASSTRKDVETAMQLAYLYYTAPRFDEDEFRMGTRQIETALPQLVNQPNYKIGLEINKTLYDSPRRKVISKEVLDNASLAAIERNYRRLFADAAGAVAVITGDFDKAEIRPLVEKYLGSIKKGGKATDWSYKGDGLVNGSRVNEFRTAMEAPKVTVLQVLKTDKPYSIEVETSYEALAYILDMVYVATLREEEGGTYGASAIGMVSNKPNETRLLQVVFETNDEQADKLRSLALKAIRDIAENGPDADMFDKAKKNAEKTIPEQKITNAFWSSSLIDAAERGTDPVTAYEAAVKALSPEMVKAAAAELIGSGNITEIVMRPEK